MSLIASIVGFGVVCAAAGYWFGETMGHANSGFHDERPFSSLTWWNFTHHFWPNMVYRLRSKARKLDKLG